MSEPVDARTETPEQTKARMDANLTEITEGAASYFGGLVTALAAVLLTGAGSTFATLLPVTWYRLQTELGLLLVVPFGIIVAGQLFFLSKLDKSPDPRVRKTGRVLSLIFQYTALFQGLVMTATVLWIVAVIAGWDTAPTADRFAEDFVLGVGYVSCFIYGATGLTILTFGGSWIFKLAGTLYAVVALVVPILAGTLYGDDVKRLCADQPTQALAAALLYFLVMSVAGMGLMEAQNPFAPEKDPEPAS